MNAVMNLRVSYNAGNFLNSRGPVSFSRRTVLHGFGVLETAVLHRQREMCSGILRASLSS